MCVMTSLGILGLLGWGAYSAVSLLGSIAQQSLILWLIYTTHLIDYTKQQ